MLTAQRHRDRKRTAGNRPQEKSAKAVQDVRSPRGLVKEPTYCSMGILKKHIQLPIWPPPAPKLTLRPVNHSAWPSSKRKLPPAGAPRVMRWTAVRTFFPL